MSEGDNYEGGDWTPPPVSFMEWRRLAEGDELKGNRARWVMEG